ncbi:MAG TPA: hypothetical protein VKX96_02665 [Chloroflexota bacterium]|nr:hypothetical protein [Chloroflexota bacterium]
MDHTSSPRSRLTIDLDPALRRRIKVAAIQNEQSVSEYVRAILERALPTQSEADFSSTRRLTKETIDYFHKVREETMRGRRFSVDSTDLINDARDERISQQ